MALPFFSWTLEAYYCLRRSIRVAAPSVDLPDGVMFRMVDKASASDVHALVEAWPEEWVRNRSPDSVRRVLERWLRQGDECGALWQRGRIVAASWVSYAGSPFLQEGFAAAFALAEAEVLRRTVFVIPDCRGMGLQDALRAGFDNYLATQRGIRSCIAYVGVHNIASAINAYRAYQTATVIYHVTVEVLGAKWNWFPKLSTERWMPCRPGDLPAHRRPDR